MLLEMGADPLKSFGHTNAPFSSATKINIWLGKTWEESVAANAHKVEENRKKNAERLSENLFF